MHWGTDPSTNIIESANYKFSLSQIELSTDHTNESALVYYAVIGC